MDDDAFLGYLQYLAYWTKPEFARFIIYPGSLQALELILQSPAKAAKLLKDGMFCEHLLFQQRCGWQS